MTVCGWIALPALDPVVSVDDGSGDMMLIKKSGGSGCACMNTVSVAPGEQYQAHLLAIFATSHLGAGMNIDYAQLRTKGNEEKQLVRYTALRLEGNCSQLEAGADAIESQSDCVQNFKSASCRTMPSCAWMVMATDILW